MSKRGRKKKSKVNINPLFIRSLFAIMLFVFAGLTTVSFIFPDYSLNSQILKAVRSGFGFTSVLLPFLFIVVAFMSLQNVKTRFANFRTLFGLVGLLLTLSGIFHIFYSANALEMAQKGYGGGFVGYQISLILRNTISVYGGFVLLLGALIVFLLVLFNSSLDSIFEKGAKIKGAVSKASTKKEKEIDVMPIEEAIQAHQTIEMAPVLEKEIPAESRKEKKSKIEIIPSHTEPQNENIQGIVGNIAPDSAVKFAPSTLPYSDKIWELPPLDILNDPVPDNADRGDIKLREKVIIDTLKSFKINAQIKATTAGPTVTRYSIHIDQGTRLTRITELQNEIALALASPTGSVRIEAPIPGTHFIGIEVPNNTRSPVCFKEVFTSEAMRGTKARLPIVLGKDVGGAPRVEGIEKMPHMLVAGSTGSGKSVFLHSIMFSILFKCSPLECQLILVDPKKVELIQYQDIPHLKAPVITDIERAPHALNWAVQEMTRRYTLFESVKGVRNIEDYNTASGFQALPYLVIIIDELAEIMMTDPTLIEKSIIRLAQAGRASGIHLVLTTQRPSTNVVTGLIKANVPTKVAFNVTSNTDSRVIIDQAGAEKLMGKGDMLYLPQDANKPSRLQGAMVTNKEIEDLVNYLKSTGFAPDYKPEIFEAVNTRDGVVSSKGGGGDLDPLFDEAVELVQSSGKASTSYLQRRFQLGYSRAAKIIDQLEAAGIVGPSKGSKPREVLVNSSEDTDSFDNIEMPKPFKPAPEIDYEDSRTNITS